MDARPALLAFVALLGGCSPDGEGEPTALPQDEQQLRDQLSAIGYVGHVEGEQRGERVGVFLHDESRASRGLTVYGSRRGEPRAYVFDVEGNEVWRWEPKPTGEGNSLLWIRPARDGNLLVMGRRYLVKMDWDANILWQAPPMRYHHDFAQDDDGQIWAMAVHWRELQHDGAAVRIADDHIVVLSSDGELIREISMIDVLGVERIPPEVLEMMADNTEERVVDRQVLGFEFALDHPFDFPHLNSLVVIDRDIGVAKKGDLLLCMRSMDLVLVFDPLEERIVWEWGQGELDRPHRPWLLDNDNILLFDNGWRRGYSRLVELDPRSGEIVWQYVGDPVESFFSRRGGMAQPLGNGNLLVTESDKGHIFELTRQGEIVWSFWNPEFKDNGKRQTIYRSWRWTAGDLAPAATNEALAGKLRALGYLK